MSLIGVSFRNRIARRAPRTALLAVVVLAGVALAAPGQAEDAADTGGAAIARAFSQSYMEGDLETCMARMTPEVKAGFPPEQARTVRSQLIDANGSFHDVGEAWLEIEKDGYRRYRVPVRFEHATLDFRVVLDGNDRVAGFFTAAHVEPPGAAAGEPVGDPVEVARTFSRLIMEGDLDACRPLMDETMRSAFTADQATAIRDGLTGSNGALRGVGEAWHQDDVQGYRRYRVPVTFEKATVDFQVVFDASGHVAGFFVQPHVEPPGPDETGAAPGVERDVLVGSGDDALPGTLTLPKGQGPFPGAVLVHGSGPNDRDETIGPNKPFRDLAWGLAERGVAVLRYDKRSFAAPNTLTAAGDRLTVEQEVIHDARAALDVLRDVPEVDPKRVWVIGHSLGGTLAPRIAAADPHPAGIVILAGATLPLPEKIVEQSRYIVSLDGQVDDAERARLDEIEAKVAEIRAALDGERPAPEGVILGAPMAYWSDLEGYDAPSSAAALGLPSLVLQGGRDYQVTREDFARWREALAGKPFACLHVYEAMDHLFRRGEGTPGPHDYDSRAPLDPEVVQDVAAWIESRSCPSADSTAAPAGR